MLAPVQTVSPLPSASRPSVVQVDQGPLSAAGGQDNRSGEVARPVEPVGAAVEARRISQPRLANLFLPEGRGEPARGAADGTDAGGTATPLAAEPKGPLRSFADIPTRLTREIQKAREAIAEEGGGVEAMRAMMRALAAQQSSGPTLSITI